ICVAGRDDRQGGPAGGSHHRGPRQLPPASRPLEDQWHGARQHRGGVGHPRRCPQTRPAATVCLSLMAADTLDDCALVIMAKAPRAGHVKTRLAQVLAPEAIVAVYRCLIEDTLALARAVGAPRAHRGLFDRSGIGTGNALRALLGRARTLGLCVALAEEWYDVDDRDDLARLAAELREAPSRAPRTAAWLAARREVR